MYSIGELSRRTSVKVPTIRYYEQMGLIDTPERSEGNQRRYARSDLERLAFIRHARDLGFTIDAIRQLIDLGDHAERPCADADRIATEQLVSVRTRIAQLRRLEAELARIATCCTGETIGECYVIRALSDHSLCESEHSHAASGGTNLALESPEPQALKHQIHKRR
ncbi:MerR family transcriptional regulator [Phyllobacterium salinisoli]|uniref:MerR family transcriptional regulator n=1 Tax=Phyllobacterium salinisoli TaxID=1899321 RepID=A0A368K1E8_9HYPH|nr:MerR family transcriptional regulator [Phyllobacterium salinisoli]